MQFAQELQRIADNGSPRGSTMWRALAAQHPRLFRQRPDEGEKEATMTCSTRSIREIREIAQQRPRGDAA